MNDGDQIRSTAGEDAATESAVLQQVLALHPAPITLDELLREFAEDRSAFAERDAVERAVRDLVSAGLLQCSETFVMPTRAALRFDQILGG